MELPIYQIEKIIMTSYYEQIKSPEWQKKRLEILDRDKFTCRDCGDKKTELHVHHLSYEYKKEIWNYDNSNFVTLCKTCHEHITALKKDIKCVIDNSYLFTDILSELHGLLVDLTEQKYTSIEISALAEYVRNKKSGK